MKRLLTLLYITAMLVTPVFAEETELLSETDIELEMVAEETDLDLETEELLYDEEIELLAAGTVSERDFMPTGLFIIGATDSLKLTWRNPKSDTLRSVKLYDITDGETELTGYNINQEAYGSVGVKLLGLTENSDYTYKIVCDFSEHDSTTFKFGARTEGTAFGAISGWGRETYSGDLGYTPINYYPYTGDAHSGNACLKIVSNHQGTGNCYHTFMSSVEVSSDKNYQFSFWVKGNMGGVGFFNHWANFGAGYFGIKEGEATDWKQYVYTLSNPNSKTLRINMEKTTDIFMIDDIELYELDENGEIVGENLVPNSSFESGVDISQKPEKIIEVTANTDIPEQVTLSWPEISDNSAKINIYRKFGDEYVLLSTWRNNVTSVTLEGLTTDEENSVAVAIENSSYMESELYELTVVPKSYPYTAEEIIFKKGSTVLEEVESGRVTISSALKNNSMGDDFTAEVIGALYKDGILYKVFAGGAVNIPQTPSADDPVVVSVNVSAPTLSELKKAQYTLEAFLWTSYEDMSVLSPCKVITENR